jgi:hypothetical protein
VAVFFVAVRALLAAVLAARVFLEAVFGVVRLALGMLLFPPPTPASITTIRLCVTDRQTTLTQAIGADESMRSVCGSDTCLRWAPVDMP